MNFITRLFDKKISDTTTDGYKPNEIQKLLNGITNIDTFQYYYYLQDSKYPTDSEKNKNQPVTKILTILNQHFTESLSLHTETQHKTYKSGKHQIILKGRNQKNEIIKLSVLEYNRPPDETSNPKT